MASPVRPIDVFVSYSRRSSGLCETVVALLEGALNLAVFRDVNDIHPGSRWVEEIERQLETDRRPAVLLLATRAAVEHGDNIVRELALALQNGLHIVPLEADPGCARRLLNAALDAAGLPPDGRHVLPQVLAVHDAETGGGARLEDGLRRGLLGPRLEELLTHRTESYAAWRGHLSREHSFWAGTTSTYADTLVTAGGLALIGPAGAGKSSLAAHIVESLVAKSLRDPDRTAGGRPVRWRPVLLREADLRDRGDALARGLGARGIDELQAHLEGCRESFGVQLLFVVDGLDQMAPDLGQTFRGYAEALARLSRVAPTLVTCRREVWDEAYRRDVSLPRHDIEHLSPATVQHALDLRLPGRRLHANPLLQRALFLDLLLSHGERWTTVPDDDLRFLEQLWRDLCGEQRQPRKGGLVSQRQALIAMAKEQLARRRFEVPWTDLVAPLSSDVRAAIEALIEARILRRVGDDRIRFSHDLLDAYSMAEGLLAAPQHFDGLVEALPEDGMWSVAATFGALAGRRSPERMRALFEAFLTILDNKPKGDSAMARAWAVTYALQERFEDFLPLILECFQTDELQPHDAPSSGSSLAPPNLTQPAASTLASAFLALRGGRVEDAARVLPRLCGKLYTWRLRFRVVEAIAKFDAPEARDALVEFARSQWEAHTAGAERFDERALIACLKALVAYDHAKVREILQLVEQDTSLNVRVRRAAQQSLGLARSSLTEPLALSDAELVDDLRPLEPDRDRPGHMRYTDWRGVEAAAKAVESRIRATGEQPSPIVAAALVRALAHDQTAVRCTVAECLALVDAPEAATALVAELGEADVPPQVRGACVAALLRVLHRTSGLHRLALRLDAARGAVVARRRGRELAADALWTLATGHETTDGWPILGGGAALTTTGGGALRVVESYSASPPPSDGPAALLQPDELAAAGEELEVKFRYTGVEVRGGVLALEVGRSSWPLGRAFHVLARDTPERLVPGFPTAALLPRPFGEGSAPGIACVHAVVRTSDGQVLLAQRSLLASYWPGAWSISFEEQVTASSGDRPEDAVAAALRGFEEEFGLVAERSHGAVMGALLELDTLNVAVVVRLDVPFTAEQILTRWSTEPRPSHHHEAVALAFVSDEAAQIAALIEGRSERDPLHPTSRLRLAMAGFGDRVGELRSAAPRAGPGPSRP
jgi:hypothetical protein